MNHKPDGSIARRILTFPAIHPCEAISPATLLASLIVLARRISGYRTEFIATNRRNARQSIRLVGILLIILEELRDHQPNLPNSSNLSFSDLHLTFQKIQYLLEDCTRRGSRLWMLMNYRRVANQFRVLCRGIATALDVLPLDSYDISIESREMIEMVMRQSRRSRFEAEVDDERAFGEVTSILNSFEGWIVPDRSSLRQILEQLGVRSWSECNKEIKFLDSEIGLEYLNGFKTEEVVLQLSSLIGFMNYCRCVVFDVVDGGNGRQSDLGCSGGEVEVLSYLNPDDFRCPITLEFMTDPVTIKTGHTYDRSSILKWFKAGNPTCPKTGKEITNKELVPNLALRRLIRQYCSDNGFPIAESLGSQNREMKRKVLVGSPAAMQMLAAFLSGVLANGSSEERNKAAYEIRLLSKTSISNRFCLAEAGTIPHLLDLLFSTDPVAQENAIAALLNLSKHSKSKTILVENGGLEVILDVLKRGQKMEARQHAAATLFYLSSVEEYRKLIGEIPEAIPALVEMVKDGTSRGRKNALVTILGLLMYPDNHWRVLAAGTIPLLINLLKSSEREDLVPDSLAVLATLAEKPDGTIAIIRRRGLDLVIGILNSTSSRAGKEYCVSLLLALCINGGRDVVGALVNHTSLMEPLYSLLTEGTSRASKKASSLIRMLHQYHESTSGLKIQPLQRDRFVHAWITFIRPHQRTSIVRFTQDKYSSTHPPLSIYVKGTKPTMFCPRLRMFDNTAKIDS